MIIYGAGLTGLIAANIFQRSHTVEIREAQMKLPHNHQALLRFRSPKVGQAVGIPFREVTVHKAALVNGELTTTPNLLSNNLYSRKVTGSFHNRSILNLEPTKRWIAPRGFNDQLAAQLGDRIIYGEALDEEILQKRFLDVQKNTFIQEEWLSTIPLPTMIALAKWKPLDLQSRSIAVVHGIISHPRCDLYQTIYFPDPNINYYRASITGNQFILEYNNFQPPTFKGYEIPDVRPVLYHFGMQDVDVEFETLLTVTFQKHGKILPSVDDQERKRTILALTDLARIYSLGRFAVWRQILQDDVIQDIDRINVWMGERSGYQRRLST